MIKGLGPGGAERLLCAQARAHHHDRYHIECAYVLPWKDHLAEELEQAGVRTHCLSQRRTDCALAAAPQRRWCDRVSGTSSMSTPRCRAPSPDSSARTMPKARRPKLISTEHNRWATHRLPTRLANRLSSRWDDVTFAVTDEVRDSLSGSAAKRAVTLQHGIDVESVAKARADRAEVRAELGIGPDEIVVGTVANFRPQKDYPNLLAAAKLLADRGVAVRFVAVGQGPQASEVAALHEQLGLGDRVILTGFRDDAVRVMGACDIFTLASKWEGLPVALMEALALGLPIVATKVGGVAEAMHDGQDAVLVPPGDAEALADALQKVVEDSSLRAQLATAAAGPSARVRREPNGRNDRSRLRQRSDCDGRRPAGANGDAAADCHRASRSGRQRPTTGRRSSSCADRRSDGATILGSSSCSRGSTTRTRSARRTCGSRPTVIEWSACERSCDGSSCAVAKCYERCVPSTRQLTPTTRARACSRR